MAVTRHKTGEIAFNNAHQNQICHDKMTRTTILIKIQLRYDHFPCTNNFRSNRLSCLSIFLVFYNSNAHSFFHKPTHTHRTLDCIWKTFFETFQLMALCFDHFLLLGKGSLWIRIILETGQLPILVDLTILP